MAEPLDEIIPRLANAARDNLDSRLNVYEEPPSNLQLPALVMEPEMVDWSDTSMGNSMGKWTIVVYLFISLASKRESQKSRMKWFGGANDVKAALETAGTDVFVRQARKFTEYRGLGNEKFLGVEFVIDVFA